MLLERYAYAPDHVRGRLYVNENLTLETIERPWVDNKPFVSCIPDGLYTLNRHESDRRGETVALVNEDLNVFHWDQGYGRSVCLFHSANFAHQLHGCIAVGTEAGVLFSKGRNDWLPAVKHSRRAMEQLRPHLKHGGQLHIKPVTGTNFPGNQKQLRAAA